MRGAKLSRERLNAIITHGRTSGYLVVCNHPRFINDD